MNGWLKILALCSTVALGSGYVWWSQKKSTNHRKEVEGRSMSSSKSKVTVDESQPFDGTIGEQKDERAVLPGSKSAAIGSVDGQSIESILNPLKTGEKNEKEPEKRRTVLPGSKSIDPILSPDHKP